MAESNRNIYITGGNTMIGDHMTVNVTQTGTSSEVNNAPLHITHAGSSSEVNNGAVSTEDGKIRASNWRKPDYQYFQRRQLDDQLQQLQKGVPIILHGSFGVGKSSAALNYLVVNKDKYDISWLIDLNILRNERVAESLTKLARKFSTSYREMLTFIEKRAKEFEKKNVIFLLDNLKSMNLKEKWFEYLWNVRQSINILITTNDRILDHSLWKECEKIEVDRFHEGIEFLKDLNGDTEMKTNLCDYFGWNISGLKHAKVYIVENFISINDYLEMLKRKVEARNVRDEEQNHETRVKIAAKINFERYEDDSSQSSEEEPWQTKKASKAIDRKIRASNWRKPNYHYFQRKELDDQLQRLQKGVPIILHGSFGVGKSSAALNYLVVNKDKYDISWVIDLNILKNERVAESLTKLARKFSTSYQGMLKRADEWNVIFLLDNLKSMNLRQQWFEYLWEVRHSINILITTNYRILNHPLWNISKKIEVVGFNEGIEFLKDLNDDKEMKRRLCDYFGWNIRGLKHAKVYIVANFMSINDYLSMLKRKVEARNVRDEEQNHETRVKIAAKINFEKYEDDSSQSSEEEPWQTKKASKAIARMPQNLDEQQRIPETMECTPETSECTPDASEYTPEIMECTPETSEYTPETMECTPETMECTPDTNSYLMDLAREIPKKWKTLAIYLKVQPKNIDEIELNHHNDVNWQGFKMLEHWLQSRDDEQSWYEELGTAFERIDRNDLARKIVTEGPSINVEKYLKH